MSVQRDPEWVLFRRRLIDTLDRIDASRFVYLDANHFVHICPACRSRDGWLRVHFHGVAPRADATCSLGCAEADIAVAIGAEVIA